MPRMHLTFAELLAPSFRKIYAQYALFDYPLENSVVLRCGNCGKEHKITYETVFLSDKLPELNCNCEEADLFVKEKIFDEIRSKAEILRKAMEAQGPLPMNNAGTGSKLWTR